MFRWITLTACILGMAAPLRAADITGHYVEARTCDIWVAPCFANAEMNLSGKHAVMAWKVDRGTLQDVRLDGLGIVAVVAASDTLGLKQTGPARAILIVDSRADAAQRDALVLLAKNQGGDLLRHVVRIETAPIDLMVGTCKEGGCAHLEAGNLARIETRCIDLHHDRSCGNESAFYPPLAKDVSAVAAVAVEHTFTGTQFRETWKDANRRGAYVGSFAIR